MSQRETPMLLAGGSSSIICIFPNLQNVNILGKKYADISHFIPDETPCHSLAPCSPLSESLTSGRQPEHLGFNTECWAVLMSAHAGASGSAQTRALPLSGLWWADGSDLTSAMNFLGLGLCGMAAIFTSLSPRLPRAWSLVHLLCRTIPGPVSAVIKDNGGTAPFDSKWCTFISQPCWKEVYVSPTRVTHASSN